MTKQNKSSKMNGQHENALTEEDVQREWAGLDAGYRCCVMNPNTRPMPWHRDDKGMPVEDKEFWTRVNIMLKPLERFVSRLAGYNGQFRVYVGRATDLIVDIRTKCQEDYAKRACPPIIRLDGWGNEVNTMARYKSPKGEIKA